jgi:hypothetical protein
MNGYHTNTSCLTLRGIPGAVLLAGAEILALDRRGIK